MEAGHRGTKMMAGMLAMLSILTGCAAQQPTAQQPTAQQPTAQQPTAQQPAAQELLEGSEQWRLAQGEVLKTRAEARWEALIKGDLDAEYLFTTPEYRSVVNLQQHRRKYGRGMDWRVARVVNVGYDDSTVATVSLGVTYRLGLPGTPAGVIENQTILSEKWIYKDREWWFVTN